MKENFNTGPRIPYPDEININSAHVLIDKLTTTIAESRKINSEEIAETLDMIKTLEDLQRDLSDGSLRPPSELNVAIAKLRDLINRDH